MSYIRNGKLSNDGNKDVFNSSFQFGLNVFEGIRVYRQEDGKSLILGINEHIDRLRLSCKGIGLRFDYNNQEIIDSINILCSKEKLYGDLYIRIMIFNQGQDSWSSFDLRSNYVILIKEYSSQTVYINDIGISKIVRISPENMNPSIKCGANYINSRYALLDVRERGYKWALFLNSKGRICESTGANIFFLSGNKIITPSISENILSGITREIILKLSEEWGFQKEVRPIELKELNDFDGAFLSGTSIQVAPILSINRIIKYKKEKSELITNLYSQFKRNLCKYKNYISSELIN